MESLQNDKDGNVIWFTQKELADRWRISPGSIINLRKNGKIPFFKLPDSSRVLYPVNQIIELEQQHTQFTKEEKKKRKQPAELKRKKPVVSAKPKKEWRI